MRNVLVVLSLMLSLSGASASPGRAYAPRTGINARDYEKVALNGRYALYLPRDQDQKGTFAPAKGGHQLLIGYRPSSGPRRFARAELQGRRGYQSGAEISRSLKISLRQYVEKSVVAYLPSKDPRDPRPRFYSVIGPRNGKGPLLIERRPSLLTGGKPLEYSILEL